MKIIKVIVDEVPISCYYCPYMIYDDEADGYICLAKIVSEFDNLITDTHARPDWCPLIAGTLVEVITPDGDCITFNSDGDWRRR